MLMLSLSCAFAFIATYFALGQKGDYTQPFRERLLLDDKPFNCVTCLSGWAGIALIIFGLAFGFAELKDSYVLLTTPVFSLILYRLIP